MVDQPTNRQIFDTYIETQLAPTLAPGDGKGRQQSVRPGGAASRWQCGWPLTKL